MPLGRESKPRAATCAARKSPIDDEQPGAAVKATGRIGVVGVFVPEAPGIERHVAKRGQMAFDFGQFWFKARAWAPARRT
jgi:hypothetical protein